MSEKVIKTRVIHKHDIEAKWNEKEYFFPKQGEIIVYDIDEEHPYERMKIGDGVTSVINLPFSYVGLEISETVEELETGIFYANADKLGGVMAEEYSLKSQSVTVDEEIKDLEQEIYITNTDKLGGIDAAEYALKNNSVTIVDQIEDLEEGSYLSSDIKSAEVIFNYSNDKKLAVATISEPIKKLINVISLDQNICLFNPLLKEQQISVKPLQLVDNSDNYSLKLYTQPISATINYY